MIESVLYSGYENQEMPPNLVEQLLKNKDKYIALNNSQTESKETNHLTFYLDKHHPRLNDSLTYTSQSKLHFTEKNKFCVISSKARLF